MKSILFITGATLTIVGAGCSDGADGAGTSTGASSSSSSSSTSSSSSASSSSSGAINMCDVCVAEASCVDGACVCPPGFEGDGTTTGAGCADVDECATGNGGCDDHAVCSNAVGSYTCACKSSYNGDGMKSGAGCTPDVELLWYRFDGAGTDVPNLAASPPPGTAVAKIKGALTQGGAGVCGGGLVGNGDSSSVSYMDTGWVPELPLTGWTISFWVSNMPASAAPVYVFGDVTSSALQCFANGDAGQGNWMLRGPTNDIFTQGGVTSAPSMITFVYTLSSSRMKAFVNGSPTTEVVQQGVLTWSGSGPFKVGGYSDQAGLPLGAVLDELRVYSRALSPQEVSALYTTSAVCD